MASLMKWKSKWILLLTILVVIVSGCSSQGNGNGNASTSASPASTPAATESSTPTATATESAEPEIDISEEVKLKLVLLGAPPADTDEVYAEVNKILKEKANATIELSFIDWGETGQKYPLMFASNEDFDMAFTASWIKYTETANKNGFLELTPEMLQKYAPVTWENQPKEAWDQAKINGKIFMVANDVFEVGSWLTMIRGDLREKYDIEPLKSVDDFYNYAKTIAANEKEITAWFVNSTDGGMEPIFLNQPNEFINLVGGVGGSLFGYDINDPEGKVFSYYDSPAFLEFIKSMKDLADHNVWSKNASVSKEDKKAAFVNGKSAMIGNNIDTLANISQEVSTAHPDWKPEIYDLSPDSKRYVNTYIGNGIGIHKSSKNPERALMVLDLLRYDKEIHDLTNYGIKGKHWEPVGDDQYKALDASTNYPPSGACPWGWNSGLERTSVDAPPQKAEYYEKWKSGNIVHHELETFSFNSENVKTEMAAVSNVMNAYFKPVMFGLVDPEEGLATLKTKLEEAGVEKIRAELEAKIAEFKANN